MGQTVLSILHFTVICHISMKFLAALVNINPNSFKDHAKFSKSLEKLNGIFIVINRENIIMKL